MFIQIKHRDYELRAAEMERRNEAYRLLYTLCRVVEGKQLRMSENYFTSVQQKKTGRGLVFIA